MTAKVGADARGVRRRRPRPARPARRRRQVGPRRGVGRSERVAGGDRRPRARRRGSASSGGSSGSSACSSGRPTRATDRTAPSRSSTSARSTAARFRSQPHEVLEVGVASPRRGRATGTTTTNSSRGSRSTVGRAAPTSCTAERRVRDRTPRRSRRRRPRRSIDTDDSAAARFASWRSLSRSTKCVRTPRTWVGAASRRRFHPSSVSTALEPRRSVGHCRRSTSPGRTRPSIAPGDAARREVQRLGEVAHPQAVVAGAPR